MRRDFDWEIAAVAFCVVIAGGLAILLGFATVVLLWSAGGWFVTGAVLGGLAVAWNFVYDLLA